MVDRGGRRQRELGGSPSPTNDLGLYEEELEQRIRELHEAQEAIAEARERYADLYDHAPIGYVTLDAVGRIVECNLTACHILERARAPLTGCFLRSLVLSEDRRLLIRHLFRSRTHDTVTDELRLEAASGRVFPAQLVTRAAVSSATDGWTFRTAILDLTEKKKVEAALVQSEQRLQTAVEASGAGIFEVELPSFERIYLDARTASLLGIEKAGELAALLKERVLPEDQPHLRESLDAALGGERPRIALELRVRRGDNGVRYLKVWARVGEVDEGRRRVVGAVMDATPERERSLELERRARQLQRLTTELHDVEERERRKLASELHDDLAQLLVAARMKIETLASSLEDAPEHEQVASLEALLDAAHGSVRSVMQRMHPPVLDTLGLPEAIEWLGYELRRQFDLEVRVEVEKEPPKLSERYRLLLFRCVRELLVNVAKHARTLRATVRIDREGERRIRITVEDEGAGFDPAELEAGDGRGFGLMSLRERLRNLGGSVRVESSVGRGTRVVLSLPLVPTDAEGVHEAPAERPRAASSPRRPRGVHRKIRVLIADDHELVRSALARMLESQEDLEIVGEAGDGEGALELVDRVSPDVVLMDVSMPGLGGIAATERLVRRHPEVRVIALSMHDEEGVMRAMSSAGAVGYVTKSKAAAHLLGAIRSASREESPVE